MTDLLAIESSLRSLLADVLQTQNEGTVYIGDTKIPPIRRLPSEVLSMVFRFLLPTKITEATRNLYGWVRILRVSRRWHELAISTPQLWRDLDLDKMSSPSIFTWVTSRKSLDFSIRTCSFFRVVDLVSLYPHVRDQIHEVSYRYVEGSDLEPSAWIAQANCPAVSSLRLDYSDSKAPRTLLPITTSALTRLTLLYLKGVPYQWERGCFPATIQVISIDCLRDAPTMDSFFEAMDSLKSLRVLSLSTETYISPSEVTRDRRLSLPSIEQVTITTVHVNTRRLLDMLPQQSRRRYNLHICTLDHSSGHSAPGLIRSVGDAIKTVMEDRHSVFSGVRFVLEYNQPRLFLGDEDGWRLSIAVQTHFDTLCREILRAPLTNQINRASIEEMDSVALLATDNLRLQGSLQRLASITSLTIRGRIGIEASSLLASLSTPIGPYIYRRLRTYPVQWPLLKVLRFEDIHRDMFGESSDAANNMGSCLWGLRARCKEFERVEVERCGVDEHHLRFWKEFIPTVIRPTSTAHRNDGKSSDLPLPIQLPQNSYLTQ